MECVPNTPDLATSVSENPENRAEVSALDLFINDFINEQKKRRKIFSLCAISFATA